MKSDFCVFILTHGRPNKVTTYKTLKKQGYTGSIRLIVDDKDKTLPEYQARYNKEVIVFNKEDIVGTFDEGDNFQDFRSVIYARNACHGIARDLGVKYFLELDDDYSSFIFKRIYEGKLQEKPIKDLDKVFNKLLEYYKSIPALSIALAQNGDFIGGVNSGFIDSLRRRKCMNSFFCSIDRPFKFVSRMNDDVSTYISLGSRGKLFLTMSQVSLIQQTTQSNAGGLTDIYLAFGTYVKSFYTVMYAPSCVTVSVMGEKHKRIHHRISWKHAVPVIISEKFRKIEAPF